MLRFAAIACVIASGCDTAPSVCDEAEALAIECGNADDDIDFGECTGDTREAAEAIVKAGCAGLSDQKSDLLSQLCLGPLEKLFPWCGAEDYSCDPDDDDLDATRCNGSVALCDRPYDQGIYATSHNAFSAASMDFARPNQSKRMYVQLRDGMRALMVDSRRGADGQLSMCHLDCSLGEVSFVDGLREVRDFLDCYPNEVITLIIEPHAPGPEHVTAIQAAGLEPFVYTHRVGQPWPTLGEMIRDNTRLVIFTEVPGENTPAWYHHQWDFAFDTEFSVKNADDFGCDLKRGETSNALFGLNHFVTIAGGDEFFSIRPNQADNIHGHVDQCRDAFGRLPNFIAVDFHDIGDIVEVTAELNL